MPKTIEVFRCLDVRHGFCIKLVVFYCSNGVLFISHLRTRMLHLMDTEGIHQRNHNTSTSPTNCRFVFLSVISHQPLSTVSLMQTNQPLRRTTSVYAQFMQCQRQRQCPSFTRTIRSAHHPHSIVDAGSSRKRPESCQQWLWMPVSPL